MTRKRFIKLLMARGFSRNSANDEAVYCRFLGYTYSHYYKKRIPWRELQACVKGFSEGLKKLNPTVFKLAQSLTSLFSEVTK